MAESQTRKYVDAYANIGLLSELLLSAKFSRKADTLWSVVILQICLFVCHFPVCFLIFVFFSTGGLSRLGPQIAALAQQLPSKHGTPFDVFLKRSLTRQCTEKSDTSLKVIRTRS